MQAAQSLPLIMLTEVEHLSFLLQITLSLALVKYKPCDLHKTNTRLDGLRKWHFVAWDRNSSTNLQVWRKKELQRKTNCHVAKETVYILPVVIKKNIAHALLKRKVNLVLMSTVLTQVCADSGECNPLFIHGTGFPPTADSSYLLKTLSGLSSSSKNKAVSCPGSQLQHVIMFLKE